LADGRAEVDSADEGLATPFSVACQNGYHDVVALLLGDKRINTMALTDDNTSPLWMASQNGHLAVVELLLVSGRELDTKIKSRDSPAAWGNKTAIEIARLQGSSQSEPEEDHPRIKYCPLIVSLLESFEANPAAVRRQLRELPHLRDPFIGNVFALVVFLCDGLLRVKKVKAKATGASASSSSERFFWVASRLPMELQMLLCNRVFGSRKEVVLTKYSEPAFMRLARKKA